MEFDHDYKTYPELTNTELQTLGLTSPHPQITEDFVASVVKVHDGDTVTLRTDFRNFDFPLRFAEINAPELSEDGGKESAEWMKQQIEGKEVQVLIDPDKRTEKYGRLLGWVSYGGINMSEMAVNLGYAKKYEDKDEGKIPASEKVLSEAMLK